MKKNIVLIATILSCFSVFSQTALYKLELATYDLVYDKVTDKIYASILSTNGSNGNSIGIINPHTGELEGTVIMGSEPTKLALSDDGKYIYTAFAGSSSVRRFHVEERQAGLQFPLGYDFIHGPFYAEDIEVMPGQNSTIAVSLQSNEGSHIGVAIFDHEIMRPLMNYYSTCNVIEFKDSANLIGFNFSTTAYDLTYLKVVPEGVSVNSVTANVLTYHAWDFDYHDNRIYGTDGTVAFVAGFPFAIGKYPGANGPVIYDTYSDHVCYANINGMDNIEFARYFAEDFRLLDKYPIAEATGYPYSITTCGRGCYAFNTTDYQLFILWLPTLGNIEQASGQDFKLYPNPITDKMILKSNQPMKEIEIYNLNGQILHKQNTNNQVIDFSKFNPGVYFLKIIDQNGFVYTRKAIRK
jgi:DNA-binding beta-propeller fold protein YncE